MKIKKIAVSVAALAVALTMTGCSTADTSNTEKALHYKGGAIQSQSFEGCVEPGTKDFNGPGDKHYVYPIDLRSYDATGGEASEANPISVVSNEGEILNVPVTVSFYLKSDCETLRSFHETIGDKYDAYNDGGKTSGGWRNLLDYAVGQPLNTTLDRVAQGQTWRDLYNNEELRAEIENQVAKQIPGLIQKQTGNKQFFEKFQVTVQKPTPANQALLDSIAQQQAAIEAGKAQEAKAIADGRARQAEAKAQEDAAKSTLAARRAEKAVADAEAAKRRAEIAGYGSADEYNKAKCIEAGCNPYQPTYVVPQGGPQN